MMSELIRKTAKIVSGQEKRWILTGQVTLYCTAFALLHCLIDFLQGMYPSSALDGGIALIIFICYWLNRKRYSKTAKVTLLLMLNVSLTLYASVAPKEVGIYLFFFPLISISSALFSNEEKQWRYLFMMLPFLMLVTLIVNDFDLLDGFKFEEEGNVSMFFLINVTSSGIIMILCINFILRLNEASEHELQKLAEEVNAKNNALEKTNTELDRFLYSTSHDLQSPLASIKGLINVARYDTEDKKTFVYFDKMTERVNSLEGFIKDIIDYSKNARTELREEPIDFTQLVSDVTENLKYLEGAKDIQFRRNINVDHIVIADKGRISVILSNLVANAIKYHDHKKPERWIDISVSNSNNSLKLKVTDNGSGIGAEHQSRIFEMFYRGTLQSTGSGLGLYIVKQAVERMQGQITVDSTQHEGSAFLVSLPIS